MPVSKQLRDAIGAHGTLYRVAKDSGVDYAIIRRFAAGERLPSLETVDRLCHFFGMQLTPPTRRPAAGAKQAKGA
jgi:DNA-binding phage protein